MPTDITSKVTHIMNERNTHMEPPKKGVPRAVKVAIALVNALIFIPIIMFFILVPTGKIKTLKDGHVKVIVTGPKAKSELEKGEKPYSVKYVFQKEKPKGWVTLKDMNYTAIHAIVVSEDWAFYDHSGYDMNQIKEATEDVLEGERTRGASTITQQLVKNLFLSSEKSITRKLEELGISVYLDRNVDKNKILETYLNVIEYGPGIYGIGAASQYYFKKTPKQLTPREGAFLAMLLPSPTRYSQSFKDRKMTEFANKTVDSILEKMAMAKYIRKDQVSMYQGQKFSWEKSALTGSRTHSKKTSGTRKTRRVKKKKDLSGERLESRLGTDAALELEENPNFDEDALIEDMSGLEGEFSVE